jgi:hypothetical protein
MRIMRQEAALEEAARTADKRARIAKKRGMKDSAEKNTQRSGRPRQAAESPEQREEHGGAATENAAHDAPRAAQRQARQQLQRAQKAQKLREQRQLQHAQKAERQQAKVEGAYKSRERRRTAYLPPQATEEAIEQLLLVLRLKARSDALIQLYKMLNLSPARLSDLKNDCRNLTCLGPLPEHWETEVLSIAHAAFPESG